ncbi:50S ribosomal protein L22 [Hirschia litorea]|uniref:Large ribosomal subunit protein uL22 n=1 Tax=Hirschia litorea TaxID=1199156 RepID=A0ABW2IGI3_9PROT
MGKAKNPPKQASNESRAVLRMLRVSPQKLNLIAQTIRGLSAEKAQAELTFSRKRHSQDVLKLLNSAIANAENNHGLDIDSLVVAQAHVGKNLVMKRIRARARGRAARILKPFSQLTIVLRDSSMDAESQEAA